MMPRFALAPGLWPLARVSTGALALVASGCFLPDYQLGGDGENPSTAGSGAGGAGGTATSGTGATGAGAAGGTGGMETGGTGGAPTTVTGPAGGGGGEGGTGGTTRTSPPEDCDDGADNDGDTAVDCADPDCEKELLATCRPQPPAGWSYVRADQSPFPDSSPPGCAGALLETFFSGPTPSACSQCTCNWQNPTCSQPQITCYHGNATCGGTADFFFAPTSSACVGPAQIPQAPAGVSSCVESAPSAVVNPGTCNTVTGQSNPHAWTTQHHACPATTVLAQGCGQGVCLSGGSGDFTGPLCVVAPGDLACPAGWTGKQLVHASGADNRTCAACTCGPPSTTCTANAQTIVFNNDTCSGNMNQNFNAACDTVGTLLAGAARSIKPPSVSGQTTSNGCSGGAPGGQVDPAEPHTICCAP